ncbi:MAG: Rieske (2Fe-2S) protein [Candidatus Kapabacteria bacterium]|nr:Rieske (2Fe-2S) protein [Candidatus Kapabacteria bacterium]
MEKSDRRRFLKQASMLVGAGICATCASSLLTSCEQDLFVPAVPKYTGTQVIPIASLTKPCSNEYTFSFYLDGKTYQKTILIVDEGNGKYQAFDNICPHAASSLIVQCSDNQIYCIQHSSLFNIDNGSVKKDLSGTNALKALPMYTTKVNGNNIEVTFGDK